MHECGDGFHNVACNVQIYTLNLLIYISIIAGYSIIASSILLYIIGEVKKDKNIILRAINCYMIGGFYCFGFTWIFSYFLRMVR